MSGIPTSSDEIWILALADDGDEDEDRGAVLDRLSARYQRTKIGNDQLRENLGGFSGSDGRHRAADTGCPRQL